MTQCARAKVQNKKRLAIDLCCGIGGWAEGLIKAGYEVVGFDVRRYRQGYPGQLVLQDVMTLEGKRFRGVDLIVASPPCQEFSKFDQRGLYPDPPMPDLTLVLKCFQIASEAGSPIVLENVRALKRFMGPARAHFGSFYLWGDLTLVPINCLGRRLKYNCRPKGERWGHRAPQLRAKIPFDLAYGIGKLFLNGVAK